VLALLRGSDEDGDVCRIWLSSNSFTPATTPDLSEIYVNRQVRYNAEFGVEFGGWLSVDRGLRSWRSLYSQYQLARTSQAIGWWRDRVHPRARRARRSHDDWGEPVVAIGAVSAVCGCGVRFLPVARQNLSGSGGARFASIG
jgi:hypothetical protein